MDRSGLVQWALACWAGLALIAGAVALGWTRGFDAAGLLALRAGPAHGAVGPDWLTTLFTGLTDVGGAPVRKALAALLGAFLILRGKRRAVLPLLVVMLSDGLVNDLLKAWFARPRPELVPHLAVAGGYSFPSGHSFGAAATFVTMALAAGTMAASAGQRRALIAGAAALAAAVAFSRVWLGVHYPSDAAAGWLGGAGYALAATALFVRGDTRAD